MVHSGRMTAFPEPRAAVFPDPQSVAAALESTGYLPDNGIATAAFLADALRRPLLLEGEAGVGKTSLASALAQARGTELIRLQCYEGIDAAQALYDWGFPRQVRHLRAAEVGASVTSEFDLERVENELYSERFLVARPILQALRSPGSVLLIDEIDRADDEFEAFLLEALSDFAVTIPELGTIKAAKPPFVIMTSNRTREVHDALKRRCLYQWIEHPSITRERAIIERKFPSIPPGLTTQILSSV